MSKIQIESNSQRYCYGCCGSRNCIYHVKDTNRKQFTTLQSSYICSTVLYLSCQRYKSKAIHNFPEFFHSFIIAVFIMSKIQIESNSQHLEVLTDNLPSCIYHVKDTNRKQFTTITFFRGDNRKLYLSCQRYKSKAIHNDEPAEPDDVVAVFIMSKIQIESNSQHIRYDYDSKTSCIYHVKDTNRKQFTTNGLFNTNCEMLYLSCQRYKSKAIHNSMVFIHLLVSAVFIMSKIQIESNSQQTSRFPNKLNGCIYHVKDTNRKQFTTANIMRLKIAKLYLSCQRYKSKAIHNISATQYNNCFAVFIMSKIQIESNSQHPCLCLYFYFRCIYHVKDTNRKQFTTE